MMWIGLSVGIMIGALIGEWPGALVLGFIGWLAGLIIGSQRAAKKQPLSLGTPAKTGVRYVPGTGQVESHLPLEARVATLEAAVARLEAQLGVSPSLGRGQGEGLAAPVTPDAGRAATVGGPIPEESAQLGPPAIAAEAAPGVTSEPPPIPGPPPIPEPPAPPPEPPKRNPIVAWLTGGNTIARVGLLILFLGLAFLVKYAADHRLLPPELRIIAVAIGGIALLGIGWRLRHRNPGYALGMQGAGVAVLYLTTFGALRLYQLIPPEMAFVLLAGIAVFSAMLAVKQDAVALAVIAAGGGFLAPILASSGGGNHVMLFSYYVILNLGILAIAWFKAWRALNLTGFVFTFVIALLWGMDRYRPEHFATSEPFLVAFWAIYVAIAILVAREKAAPDQASESAGTRPVPGTYLIPVSRRYVDGTLVFGVPLAAFGLQAGLMRGTEYGLALSSLAAAGYYITLAWWLLGTKRESWTLLAQSFLALGVVFVTMAIPLALDARWTSASWALEGAAIIWVGLRQQRTLARAFGYLLQLLAAAAYFEGYRRLPEGYPLVDAAFVGALIMALAGLWIHRLLLTRRESITDSEAMLIGPAFVWGLLWALFAGVDEIHAHVPQAARMAAIVAFLAALATTFGVLSLRWQWKEAASTARGLLPALWVVAIVWIIPPMIPHALSTTFITRHPLGNYGWIAWPLAFAALAWILARIEPAARGGYTTFLHAGAAVLVAFLGAFELNWIAARYTAHGTAWSVGAAAFVPALVVLLISLPAFDKRWPIADHAEAYRIRAFVVIAAWLAAWSLYANFTHDARSDPLPYLPIVNGLDLAHVFAILSIVAAVLAARRSAISPLPWQSPSGALHNGIATLAGGLAFIWLTSILLRTVSHWGGIPYNSSAMTKSVLAQASLSVFWAVLALAAMGYATRSARRPIWVMGAVLMGVVVGKLFIVDLSNVGGIERIVSFIAVGVLMLVIGYFSPVPPRKPEMSPK